VSRWESGLQDWLQPYAAALVGYGQDVRVTSVYRSYSDQLRLWLNRANNPYPVAPPGQSWHQYGRAFNLSARPEELARLGAIWLSWGGDWWPSDPIHFQA